LPPAVLSAIVQLARTASLPALKKRPPPAPVHEFPMIAQFVSVISAGLAVEYKPPPDVVAVQFDMMQCVSVGEEPFKQAMPPPESEARQAFKMHEVMAASTPSR
jgi:hypothetical protein